MTAQKASLILLNKEACVVARGVSPGMIEAVQSHIYDALARTTEHSTLTDEQQDRLLAQASIESCDLLSAWLDGPDWDGLRPSVKGTLADTIPDWERMRPFLDPLRDTLIRFSQRQKDMAIGDPDEYIDRIIKDAESTGRRNRRLDRQQLFDTATERLGSLRTTICGLAGELTGDLETRANDLETRANDAESKRKRKDRRKKVLSVLGTIATVLLSVSLAMAGANPHDVRQNIPDWGHEAVNVLVVHHVAASAQPGVRIAPPRLGPQVR
jgi:hypothetical protein